MKEKLLTGKLILVYQMPKTGSQTVEATLQHASLPHHILRSHYLSSTMAERAREKLETPGATDEWKRNAIDQIEFSQNVASILRRRNRLRYCWPFIPKVCVTCAVRDMVGLGLSSCFENTGLFAAGEDSLSIERCREVLLRRRMFAFLENWFEIELKQHFGIDVYATAFPKTTGYAIYENYFARVLVYRAENLDRLPAMLSELLRRPITSVVNRNLGSEKSYADDYRLAKENISFPIEFILERYSTRIMRHFYSAEEIEGFVRQWTQASFSGLLS
jgi:hypothetical protein